MRFEAGFEKVHIYGFSKQPACQNEFSLLRSGKIWCQPSINGFSTLEQNPNAGNFREFPVFDLGSSFVNAVFRDFVSIFQFWIFSLSAGTRFDPIPGWELHSSFLANLLLDSACFYSACGCCSEFLRLIICSGKNVKSNQITEIAEITEIFDWKFHDFYNFLKTCATLLKGYFYFEKDSKGSEIELRYGRPRK